MTTQTFRARLLGRAAFAASLFLAAPVFAQDHTGHDMGSMSDADMKAMTPSPAADTQAMPDMVMTSPLGGYGMTRDASGTSWQPDASPHDGIMVHTDSGWMLMGHALFNGVYDLSLIHI